MSIWAWIQPVDRIWKVVTDPDEGIIEIYNERDELISEHKGLEKVAVHLIEENFLNVVMVMLLSADVSIGRKIDSMETVKIRQMYEYDYMYA